MINADKQSKRQQMIKLRAQLDIQQKQCLSSQICAHLLQWPAFKAAHIVLAYAPYRGEVDIYPLLKTALAQKKRIALPKVTGRRQMHFYEIQTLDDLQPGYRGIYEPKADCVPMQLREFIQSCISEQKAVILIPGTMFAVMADQTIGRIGYGGGYYDSYLQPFAAACKDADFSAVSTCGVAYDFQRVSANDLILEKHDVYLDYLVTEKGFFPD